MGNKIKIKIDKYELRKAIFIFLLGLLFPIIFKHENLKIYDSIIYGLDSWDKEYILIAMFKLVFLNTVRSYPVYLSMIMLFDAIIIKKREKKIIYRKMILIALIIPVTYIMINMFYNIYLPFGKTSILGLVWFFYYVRLDFQNVNPIEKYSVFLFFIIGLQWLDVSPYLNFLGVGEITLFLNQAIEFMGAQRISIILCMSFFLFFILVSILLVYFFKWQEENINRQKSEIENRYLKEIQHVVHDLKTPLFSIGTLIEILDMQEKNKKHKEYFYSIRNSIEKLNLLIEEILYRDIKKLINIEDVIDLTLSILSVNEKSKEINYENYIYGKCKIYGNRILLSRVLINIITNSWEANSQIVDLVLKEYDDRIILKIEDYGDGIEGTVEKLMEEGFSTKSSSGKGLTFVKNVLKEINAKYYIFKKEKGVITYIVLEGVL
ncbi:MAG: HAMP domain-containing sensor histidine kinase [Fusobacterium sp. JB021]|nr:HAMP domain-containing sensor histidine kinase [Fusobacterium sp. JB021]